MHYDLLTTKYDLRPLVNIKGRLFHKATRSPTKKKQNKTKQKLVKSLLLIRTAEMAVQLTHFKGIILIYREKDILTCSLFRNQSVLTEEIIITCYFYICCDQVPSVM